MAFFTFEIELRTKRTRGLDSGSPQGSLCARKHWSRLDSTEDFENCEHQGLERRAFGHSISLVAI